MSQECSHSNCFPPPYRPDNFHIFCEKCLNFCNLNLAISLENVKLLMKFIMYFRLFWLHGFMLSIVLWCQCSFNWPCLSVPSFSFWMTTLLKEEFYARYMKLYWRNCMN
jgi:hypothetical protein